MDLKDRDIRQRDIISRDKLEKLTAIVIGVGAVGRQVALQLATIGVSRLVLFDPDTVGVENLSAQGFHEVDIDRKKIDAVAEACAKLNSSVRVTTHAAMFEPSLVPKEEEDRQKIFFCCVDSMAARTTIWGWLEFENFFVDTRMAAEVARVLCVNVHDPASAPHYQETLFGDDAAYEASCTSKTTIYCANLCAALAVSQLTKWLRDIPTDMDMTFNIMTGDVEFENAQVPATAEA